MGQVADAKKEKIDADAAWEMITNAKTVVIGKGKKVLEFAPDEENREEILKAAMGRSGNLRAPTIRIGDRLLIGYNDDMYGAL
ncbi:MAG TPA: hypothetical protein DHV36_14860 [Desulfobacteraceae bacterium]|nr:hypothetical protein [Desulfobacteraceae bacterium]